MTEANRTPPASRRRNRNAPTIVTAPNPSPITAIIMSGVAILRSVVVTEAIPE